MIILASLKVGGGGKTASTLAISKELSNLKIPHGILCLDLEKRLSKKEVIREVNALTDYKLASDESCYMAQSINSEFARVFICRRRDLAWQKLALKTNFKLLLSDDGWEDPRISNASVIRILSPKEKISPSKSDLFPQGPYRSLKEQHQPPLLTLSFDYASGSDHLSDLTIQSPPPCNHLGQTLIQLENTTLILGIGDPDRVVNSLKEQGLLPPSVIKLKDHSPHYQLHVNSELSKGRFILSSLKDIARLDKNLQKHPSIYGLQYSLKLNYSINKLLERANVKY